MEQDCSAQWRPKHEWERRFTREENQPGGRIVAENRKQ